MSFKQLAQRARFWLGYGASSLTEWMLAEGRTPPVRWIPWGLSWCYDLRRCFASAGKTPRMLFDVGANIGQTALHLHTHFPQATIHAFEPVPELFNTLVATTAKKKSNILCEQMALGDVNQPLEIACHAEPTMNTMCQESFLDKNVIKKIQIPCKTLDNYVEEKNIPQIDCLKIDVEGFEMQVLRGATQFLRSSKIGAIYAEVVFKNKNPHRKWTEFSEINSFLAPLGFDVIHFYEYWQQGKFKEYLILCNALWVNWDYIYRPSTQGSAG